MRVQKMMTKVFILSREALEVPKRKLRNKRIMRVQKMMTKVFILSREAFRVPKSGNVQSKSHIT